ncbi:hypothetical protein RJ639_015704 [Escallonia herrerae]|uniref:Uncharacterized protein n=1 Tax=Escallonia herrerae TaxID=1293975 RepID=A0AA88VCC3_9ASTE|nr:hypothetical protein RJ639_015704 [Escallonia herrerae]
MAAAQLDLVENSVSTQGKFKKYAEKANVISFWAFFFSIFIYIYIFYIFNLSPSTLLNTNKFWFFISNTLILIIAADFGAFSSSSEEENCYVESANHDAASTNVSSCDHLPYPKTVGTPLLEVDTSQHEKKKELMVAHHKSEVPEDKFEITVKDDTKKSIERDSSHYSMPKVINEGKMIPAFDEKDDPEKPSESSQEKALELAKKADDITCDEKKAEPKTVRSLSHKAQGAAEDEKRNVILERSATEKRKGDITETDDEFSTMSDEELNRRVEEFIQRCNRQFRQEPASQKLQKVQESDIT